MIWLGTKAHRWREFENRVILKGTETYHVAAKIRSWIIYKIITYRESERRQQYVNLSECELR